MNPFERGHVFTQAEAIDVIKTMELDVNEFKALTEEELIRFANDIIKDHNELF